MSLEGLRAWIGEVERKLAKRTRVFLALSVIAIGLSGAAIYLAIDARENSVSEGDVQELQRQLEAQIDEAATGTPTPEEPLEPTEPAPKAEPQEPQPKSGPNDKNGGTGGIGANGASAGEEGGGAVPNKASDAKIQELLEQAEEQNAEAEAEQTEK
jgi:hypothetical protein